MQLFLPVPARSGVPPAAAAMANSQYGTGAHRTLLTDNRRIGAWVARVVQCGRAGPFTRYEQAAGAEDAGDLLQESGVVRHLVPL